MENTTKWHSGQIDDETLEQCYAELDARYAASGAVGTVSVVDVTIDGSAGAANAREVYGQALVELARQHPEVVALTADLMLSHQLKGFKDTHPERFFNVGIAEANLMGVSAGLALDGKIPFATTFAAFASMRAHEQVRSDIAYPGLPVKIVGTMGGLSGGVAGPTHAGMEDIGTMRMMPGMTVIAPSDPLHLTQFVEQAYADSRPRVHPARPRQRPDHLRRGPRRSRSARRSGSVDGLGRHDHLDRRDAARGAAGGAAAWRMPGSTPA